MIVTAEASVDLIAEMRTKHAPSVYIHVINEHFEQQSTCSHLQHNSLGKQPDSVRVFEALEASSRRPGRHRERSIGGTAA